MGCFINTLMPAISMRHGEWRKQLNFSPLTHASVENVHIKQP